MQKQQNVIEKKHWKDKFLNYVRIVEDSKILFPEQTINKTFLTNLIILNTLHTIIITLTIDNKVKIWKSSGSVGFKGRKKLSSPAIYALVKTFIKDLNKYNIKILSIRINSLLTWSVKLLLRLLVQNGIQFKFIEFKNKKAHNGCRLRKKRRK